MENNRLFTQARDGNKEETGREELKQTRPSLNTNSHPCPVASAWSYAILPSLMWEVLKSLQLPRLSVSIHTPSNIFEKQDQDSKRPKKHQNIF